LKCSRQKWLARNSVLPVEIITSEELDVVLANAVATLPLKSRAFYQIFAITPFQHPCIRPPFYNPENVFVVARRGRNLLLYDDVRKKFAIGVVDANGILRDWVLYDKFVKAVRGLNSTRTFYDLAAWYILIIPFVTVTIGYAILAIAYHLSLPISEQHNVGQVVILCALFVQLVCLVLGLSICCRPDQHRRKLTIWIAVLGVLTNLFLGALTLLALGFSNIGSQC
jgi:hypothetical protein